MQQGGVPCPPWGGFMLNYFTVIANRKKGAPSQQETLPSALQGGELLLPTQTLGLGNT